MAENNQRRGFAGMDREAQRRIASMGGKAAHQSGHAHEFDHGEAVAAGRKGGEAVSGDRAHMAQIGRVGGERSHGGGRARSENAGSFTAADAEGTGPPQGEEE